jgi:hypothetical protein
MTDIPHKGLARRVVRKDAGPSSKSSNELPPLTPGHTIKIMDGNTVEGVMQPTTSNPVSSAGKYLIDLATDEEMMLSNKKASGSATIRTQSDGTHNPYKKILRTVVTTRGGQLMTVNAEIPVPGYGKSDSISVVNLDGSMQKAYAGFTTGYWGASNLGIAPVIPGLNVSAGAPTAEKSSNINSSITAALPPPLFP